MRIFFFIVVLRGGTVCKLASGLVEFQTHFVLHFALLSTMSSLQPASVSPLPEGITDPNYRPLPGRLGNLTPGQQHALNTLKQQLKDEGHFVPERMDDATLLRCVPGRCTPHPCPRSVPMRTYVRYTCGVGARMHERVPSLTDLCSQIPARTQV